MSAEKIRSLNDRLRAEDVNGRILLTCGIVALGSEAIVKIRETVRLFDTFGDDNDPYGEHDFGSLDVDGNRILFKIDYYDRDCTGGSPDPADPSVTTRVLTIMLASEY